MLGTALKFYIIRSSSQQLYEVNTTADMESEMQRGYMTGTRAHSLQTLELGGGWAADCLSVITNAVSFWKK